MPRAPLRRRQLNRNGPTPRSPRFKKIPSSSPAKAELAKKLAHKPIGVRPTDSDDSDRLVVKGNGRRGRNVASQEIYASGAVGKGDKPGNYPTRAQRRKSLTDATREILGNGAKDVRKGKELVAANGGRSRTHVQEKPVEKSPQMNGIIKKPTAAKKDAPLPATVASSVVIPLGSALRPVQPTPTRENSILGTLKPRRRQPSILQNIDQDSSSFDVEDEEQFLPDDESTPFNPSNPQRPISTSDPLSPLLSSSSRKRKFGASDPLVPKESERHRIPTTSPLSSAPRSRNTPEPSLPAIPVSTLRQSGRKQREGLRDADDIMAPPESSSSASSSPAKTKTPASTAKSKTQATKPAATITTKQLLEAAMPSKRRKAIREKTRNRNDFDIPAESDSAATDEGDESNFLPTRNGGKSRRKEPLSKPSGAWTRTKAKPKSGKAAGTAKQKQVASKTTAFYYKRVAQYKWKAQHTHVEAIWWFPPARARAWYHGARRRQRESRLTRARLK
ncbi:hypothetical protein A1O7_04333 [Cladophialophora yegresii CBS 114405]|uniref:Uncharacterized protein n=1 Tax=Cladophialophora yegresii CBS 114405 TaxID=1182544 RepID=W9W6M5_9EURO|nr:uncharacterized protein A1O7_04333 [Cladophialophora yegresii CBS 114405]EXJ60181.1 hypothetical protein A1O7_04333 [Cladophialophora yegresii CBS 114405]